MEKPHTERWAYRWFYSDKIFRLTTALYPVLGRNAFRFFSGMVAGIYSSTQPGVVGVVQHNLALFGPDAGSARRVFQNFSQIIADYVAVGAMRDEGAQALCREFIGREHIEEVLACGCGAVLATGHLGFFEYGCVVLGSMGVPMTVATMPEPTGSLTDWRAGWRRRWGVATVQVGADPFSSLAVNRALSEGRMVAVLADRPMAGQGQRFDLPGGQTLVSTTPATLGVMAGVPIIPVTVTLRDQQNYRVTAKPPIRLLRKGGADRREEIERGTHLLAESLYPEIAANSEQWFQFVPVACGRNP